MEHALRSLEVEVGQRGELLADLGELGGAGCNVGRGRLRCWLGGRLLRSSEQRHLDGLPTQAFLGRPPAQPAALHPAAAPPSARSPARAAAPAPQAPPTATAPPTWGRASWKSC